MIDKGKKRIAKIVATCVVLGTIGLVFTGGMGAPSGGGGGGMMGGGMGGGMRGGGAGADQPVRRTVVETETPVIGSVLVSGSFVGTVEPGQQVTIYPKAAGEVVEVNYSVGDVVEVGDILFKLDSTSLQLEIAQTQATQRVAQAKALVDYEAAQRTYDNYINNTDDGLNSDILTAENNVRAAEITLQQRNIEYRNARQRYSDYVNNDWDGDYDDSQRETLRVARATAELNLESAQNTLESRKTELELAKNKVEDTLAANERSLVRSELDTDFTANNIALQRHQNNLANYTVKSPISGVVEQKSIDMHNMVSTQTIAYVISNKDMVTVSFGVAELALSYLAPGDKITLEKNDQTCQGTITEVSTMIGTGGLYTVKATVENAPFDLRTGSTVKLRAVTQRVENEMIIPIDAVYYDVGKPHVFVFENNSARKVSVEVGVSDEKYIHIKSGLSLSDNVIVTWSSSLFDGAEVYLPGTEPQGEPGEESGGMPPDGAARPEGAPPEGAERPSRPDGAPQGAPEGAGERLAAPPDGAERPSRPDGAPPEDGSEASPRGRG